MTVGGVLAIVVPICIVITFVLTRLFDSWRMESKYVKIPGNKKGYRLQSAAETCMEERKEAENAIIRVLRRMERRMTLGNTVMRKLWEANPELPENEIQALERDFGITMTDRSFGIPDVD